MSNPWAQSFDDLRSPYLQEKKAKKDYDGDGKIESGAKEYRGVVHNKIQKAKGGKADGQDTSSVKEHHQKDADGNPIEHGDGTPVSLDELSNKTMRNYIIQGTKDVAKRASDPESKSGPKYGKKMKRMDGVMSAADKLAKRADKKEKKEEISYTASYIDELSKKTLGSYVKKASSETRKNMVATQRGSGIPKKARDIKQKQVFKRLKGMEKAGEKMSKESIEFTTEADKKGKGSGTKDACYHKVKSRYSVWPSAYASGALVKCRKAGAKNWGNSSKKEEFDYYQMPMKSFGDMVDECWKTHKKVGMKMKGGKMVPDCRPKNEEIERIDEIDLNKVGEKINQVKTSAGNLINKAKKGYTNFMKSDRGKEFMKGVTTHIRLSQSYEPEGEMIEAVKTPKLDIKETGVKNKIEINPEIKTEAAKAPVKKHSNSNHTERKPKKAMDAGARGRRLLQRREYAAKISGSEDRVPKELEDSYKYMTSREYTMAEAMKCWKGYKKKGTKKMFGKTYNNCVKKEELEMEAKNPEQQAAIAIAKKNRKQDLMVAKKTKKEEVQLEAKKSCGEGEYYCHDDQKCKPIPDGMKVGKDGMLVKEDMKGMSQKSGDKRSTESGAGMTAKGVAKYNRRTGGNLKTAVTTPPSKLKPGSKAAKRRKSFCARSKSWTGPRGKAARRRWNCSYEPELPMIIDEKKLYNGAPLSDRVAAWARKINEAAGVKYDQNMPYIPNQKKDKIKIIKPIRIPTGGDGTASQMDSYTPQGDGIVEQEVGNAALSGVKKKPKDNFFTNFIKGIGVIKQAVDNPGTGLNPHTRGALNLMKKLNQSYEPQGEMVERKMTGHEKDKKEDYVKGMKKNKKGFTKRYGKDAKSVMYATATKMAMKKEAVFNDPKLNKTYPNQPQLTSKGAAAFKNIPDPDIFRGGKKIGGGMVAKNKVPFGINPSTYNMLQKLDQQYDPEGQMIEAKYEKGASTYGKASIRNKRMFGKGGNAAPPEERGAAITVRRDRHVARRGIKKSNKYHEPGKYRPEVHGVNKPEQERKGKNIKEGSLHKWFKGSKSKDGKPGWVNVVTGGTCASDKKGEGTPKCVSSSKRASMTKAERLSASRRKKKADPGQQSKSGAAKPTYVSTDKPKKKK